MEFKRHVCKKKYVSCKNYIIKLSQCKLPDTETSSNVKIIFEVNVRPVIQLVYIRKQTKTRRYDEKLTKKLMKLEMNLYSDI